MRNLIIAAATAASLMVSVGAAQAFPVAPTDTLTAAPDITLVSGGCGPFGHRGFYGGCRPNGGPGFYGRPYGNRGFYGHRRFYGGYGRPYGFHRHFY